MSAGDWEWIETVIHSRSGGRCEVQSPECLAGPGGELSRLPRYRRSLHHRRPRGKGGTRRADVNSIAGLLDVCGDGTTGCHGYVERHRTWGFARGFLVPNNGTGDAVNVAAVPVTLPSGRRVLLDEYGHYLPAPGVPYELDDALMCRIAGSRRA